ncbi:MAG: hypothetical protein ACON4U_08900 [Myxococcota bacterium]
MSNLHLILVVQNHFGSLKKNVEQFKSITSLISVIDLQSTDGSYEFLSEQGLSCEQCTPEELSGTVNRLMSSVSCRFAMVMYGNETLKGNISEQLSLITEDTLIANINVRAPSWSNDILSRDDYFLEPRVFRVNSTLSFIGTAYLYPVIEPTVNMISLAAFIDRNHNSPSIINTDALYRSIKAGSLSLGELKTLMHNAHEELVAIYESPSILKELKQTWEGAQGNLSSVPTGVQILYPVALLYKKSYTEFAQVIVELTDAGEQEQCSAHAIYLALIWCAYSKIDVAQQESVYNLIRAQAERLADFTDDDFAADLLPGNNNEKSDHIRCIVALRQNDVTLASQLAEDLNISSIAGLDTQLLAIECMQNQGDGEALQASLSALEPLLKYQAIPDAWLLSACGCVLLDKLEDIESLWQPAYLQSRQGYMSPHRRHVLSGMYAMVSMLSGQPIEGHGVYGMLGAMMQRRPVHTVHNIPRSVIERSVNAMLMHNRLEYLTPLFERRSEVMVPGIRNFVTQHLNGLGFPVEDDGEPQPIFIIGDHHQIFQHCFGNPEHYQVMPSACALSEKTEKLFDKLSEVREKEFDAFSWLDEEEGESEDELLGALREQCRQQVIALKSASEKRIVDPNVDIDDLEILTEGLIDGTALIVIEDPRDYIARNGVTDDTAILKSLLEWERHIVQMRKLFQSRNYRYIETTPWLMIQNPARELNRISASIGEPMPFEQFDSIMNALDKYLKRAQPSSTVVSAVNKHGEPQLRRFGFPI